jgi:hypothetical protein
MARGGSHDCKDTPTVKHEHGLFFDTPPAADVSTKSVGCGRSSYRPHHKGATGSATVGQYTLLIWGAPPTDAGTAGAGASAEGPDKAVVGGLAEPSIIGT